MTVGRLRGPAHWPWIARLLLILALTNRGDAARAQTGKAKPDGASEALPTYRFRLLGTFDV
jgi:hypothetical protein